MRDRRTFIETGDIPADESDADFVKLGRSGTSAVVVLVTLCVTHFFNNSNEVARSSRCEPKEGFVAERRRAGVGRHVEMQRQIGICLYICLFSLGKHPSVVSEVAGCMLARKKVEGHHGITFHTPLLGAPG